MGPSETNEGSSRVLVTEGMANLETTFFAAVLAQNMLLRSTVASEAIVATTNVFIVRFLLHFWWLYAGLLVW